MANDAAARAARRRNWPIRRYALGKEPSDDLTDSTTVDERIAMVWQLTLDAWASSGRPMPKYDRAHTPGRIIRGRRGKSSERKAAKRSSRAATTARSVKSRKRR